MLPLKLWEAKAGGAKYWCAPKMCHGDVLVKISEEP